MALHRKPAAAPAVEAALKDEKKKDEMQKVKAAPKAPQAEERVKKTTKKKVEIDFDAFETNPPDRYFF